MRRRALQKGYRLHRLIMYKKAAFYDFSGAAPRASQGGLLFHKFEYFLFWYIIQIHSPDYVLLYSKCLMH